MTSESERNRGASATVPLGMGPNAAGGKGGAWDHGGLTSFVSHARTHLARFKITAAESGDQGADCHDVEDEHWINGG